MKRIIAMLSVLTLCLGLCACGGGGESIELPTKPAQVQQNENQPAASESGAVEKNAEPTGETRPWEAEFNEKDYVKFNVTAPQGEKITTWKEGSMFGTERRYLCQYPNGDIMDEYYYPSGNASHCYTWGADGSYSERHFLDDGYTDLEKMMTYTGTTIYQKNIYADGSEYEQICDDNGNVTFFSNKWADGSYSETHYFEDGTSKSVYDNPVTGEHSEQEYFENGNMKQSKAWSPEYTMDERYDEEGYRTYFYSKNADWETECIADEAGKLIKVVENGTVYEDAATLVQYAANYNFHE